MDLHLHTDLVMSMILYDRIDHNYDLEFISSYNLLQSAVSNSYEKTASILLQHPQINVNVNKCDYRGDHPLIIALRTGNIKIISLLLSHDKIYIEEKLFNILLSYCQTNINYISYWQINMNYISLVLNKKCIDSMKNIKGKIIYNELVTLVLHPDTIKKRSEHYGIDFIDYVELLY